MASKRRVGREGGGRGAAGTARAAQIRRRPRPEIAASLSRFDSLALLAVLLLFAASLATLVQRVARDTWWGGEGGGGRGGGGEQAAKESRRAGRRALPPLPRSAPPSPPAAGHALAAARAGRTAGRAGGGGASGAASAAPVGPDAAAFRRAAGGAQLPCDPIAALPAPAHRPRLARPRSEGAGRHGGGREAGAAAFRPPGRRGRSPIRWCARPRDARQPRPQSGGRGRPRCVVQRTHGEEGARAEGERGKERGE